MLIMIQYSPHNSILRNNFKPLQTKEIVLKKGIELLIMVEMASSRQNIEINLAYHQNLITENLETTNHL
jgi:hypothetical protein